MVQETAEGRVDSVATSGCGSNVHRLLHTSFPGEQHS